MKNTRQMKYFFYLHRFDDSIVTQYCEIQQKNVLLSHFTNTAQKKINLPLFRFDLLYMKKQRSIFMCLYVFFQSSFFQLFFYILACGLKPPISILQFSFNLTHSHTDLVLNVVNFSMFV